MDARAVLTVIALTSALAQAPATQIPPRTVGSVDLAKYAGTYYEIARFANPFQRDCAGDVTANYAVRPDGRVTVINRCRKADGTMSEARGLAKRAGGDTSDARLEVRFAPAWLSFLPKVWGDYWILGIGPGYSYAVVGDPARQYLWILSRVPRPAEAVFQQAVDIAAANGYDVTRLVKTPQGR